MATIKAKLRTAILTGAVGFLPSVALANAPDVGNDANGATASDQGVPDHAQAEARGAGGDATSSSARTSSGAPDHAQAEAQSFGDTARSAGGAPMRVPDHAAAERRGAEPASE